MRRGWTAGANKLNSISTRRAHTTDRDGSDRFRGILRVAGEIYPAVPGECFRPSSRVGSVRCLAAIPDASQKRTVSKRSKFEKRLCSGHGGKEA